MTYTLWGTPHSLYTGKARSYLIKKQLAFVERSLGEPDFAARVMPAVGLFVAPVLETPAGEIVQDSGVMIDVLEALHPEPVLEPDTPVQRLVSRVFDAFGSEALLALAMHYRWTYRAEQENFLRAEFGRAGAIGVSREENRAAAAKLMDVFNAFLPGLGVSAETAPALNAQWLDLLEVLDEHFQWHPYLLGGKPSRGDFGMMAPLFAHLGRDPVPAGLMKAHAPNLFNWTERMNRAAMVGGEFATTPAAYLPDDQIPDTLEPVLQLMFTDWTAGLLADAAAFNDWARDKAAGEIVSQSGQRQVHPSVGNVSYDWRGVRVSRSSQPHMLWMLAQAQDELAAMGDADRNRALALLERTGGTQALSIQLDRRMTRAQNVLILA